MNVKELIEQLSNFDQDAMVVLNGYEGGVSEVISVNEININLHVNTAWYYGKHEESPTGNTLAVYIG